MKDIEDTFKKISITGRLAFGTTCIENYVRQINMQKNDNLLLLINKLWDFTSSEDLSKWEEEISIYDPEIISENFFQISHEEEFDEHFYVLKKLYDSLPVELVSMIQNVIEIGLGNLYGGTGEYSSSTLIPTLKVYELAQKNLYSIPDITIFSKSHFSEFHGWGNKVTRGYFHNSNIIFE